MTYLRISLLVEVDLPSADIFKAFGNTYKEGQTIVGNLRGKSVFGKIIRATTFSATPKDKNL